MDKKDYETLVERYNQACKLHLDKFRFNGELIALDKARKLIKKYKG